MYTVVCMCMPYRKIQRGSIEPPLLLLLLTRLFWLSEQFIEVTVQHYKWLLLWN